MRRFVNPGKRIASFTRTFARMRWALMLDGVGVRGQLARRAINPDGDNSFEFWSPNSRESSSGTIISQNISGVVSDREFQLYDNTSGSLELVYGGQVTVLCSRAQGYEPNKKYWLDLTGSSFTLAKDVKTNIIKSGSFSKGAVREVNALTVIGARTAGSVGSYTIYSQGIQRDIKINGTRWPMADRNQDIQLPEPSGLGAELITPALLVTPAIAGSQWTYLGNGRWEYVGDGSLNQLQFIFSSSQPDSGYLEFEVESISGAGLMTCATTAAGNPVNPVFNTVGVKRYYYTSKGDSSGNTVQFKRQSGACSCVIKNFSFKPLGTCNPIVLANVTSANWEDLEI